MNARTMRDNVGNPDFIGDKPILLKKKCEFVTLILRKFKTATSHVEVQKWNWKNIEFKPLMKNRIIKTIELYKFCYIDENCVITAAL